MNELKKVWTINSNTDVQWDSVENNIDNYRWVDNTEIIQFYTSDKWNNLWKNAIEPWINDIPLQKWKTNVIRVISVWWAISTPVNMKEIVLKINGVNYTLYTKNI